MPVIWTARNDVARRAPLARMAQLGRQGPESIAPSGAWAAVALMHNLCGQLLEAMDAMVAEWREERGQGECVAAVIAAVAYAAELPAAQLIGPRRARPVAWARQVAYLLARELCPDKSLPQIARAFGGRDHTTILSGLRTVAVRLAAGHVETRRLYEAAKRRLGR